jgi:hypothetical protein
LAGALGVVLAIVGWIVLFVFLLLSGIFYKQTFDTLAAESHEGLLRTGGLIILIGSILTIIFAGFLLLFVGWILITFGIFSLRHPLQRAQVYTRPTPPLSAQTATEKAKYCPHCGAENNLGGTFCTRCGRRLNQSRLAANS